MSMIYCLNNHTSIIIFQIMKWILKIYEIFESFNGVNVFAYNPIFKIQIFKI